MANVIVSYHLDICHQILDLYSQGKQQMPHHAPHQLQQPPSLQPTPSAPPAPQSQPPPGPEPPQPPQKDSQQPAQPQPPPPAQQPKKPSPQPSPPRQAKRAVVSAPDWRWVRPASRGDTPPVCVPLSEAAHGTPEAGSDTMHLPVCLYDHKQTDSWRGQRRGTFWSQDGSVLLQPLLPVSGPQNVPGCSFHICTPTAGIGVSHVFKRHGGICKFLPMVAAAPVEKAVRCDTDPKEAPRDRGGQQAPSPRLRQLDGGRET